MRSLTTSVYPCQCFAHWMGAPRCYFTKPVIATLYEPVTVPPTTALTRSKSPHGPCRVVFTGSVASCWANGPAGVAVVPLIVLVPTPLTTQPPLLPPVP